VAGLAPASLPSAGLAPALGFALVLVVARDGTDDDAPGDNEPEGDGAGDDAAREGGAGNAAEADDGERDADKGRGDDDDDDDGMRGRTAPFPLPFGGVPLEFNAVSPLWRHHRLPVP
jgi:hypothetical protein